MIHSNEKEHTFDLTELKTSLEPAKPTRNKIVFDLDGPKKFEDDVQMDGPKKKYYKHVYWASLRKFTKSSILELLDDCEIDLASRTFQQLEKMESEQVIKKFTGLHNRNVRSHNTGRVIKSIKPKHPKQQIETFQINVYEDGDREITKRTIHITASNVYN